MLGPGYSRQDADAPIRATDSDASLARLSAVQKGYLKHDPFIKHFVPRAHLQQPRPPLINIGTTIRSESIDKLVDSWLGMCETEGMKCQIVSLGAGSDTRFWRLAAGEHKDTIRKYVEVDFPEVTSKKAMTVKRHDDLLEPLGDASQVSVAGGGTGLMSPVYNLHAGDLRRLESLAAVINLLDKTTPTLLLFECVLAYMTPKASSDVIDLLVGNFENSTPVGAIVYEMFGLEDAFGKVMRNNLKVRNVELPGVEPYVTKSSLPQRFLKHDFALSKALTLQEIRNQYIAKDEILRLSQLEMLDEVEELDLVLDHYAITWGVKISKGLPQKHDAASAEVSREDADWFAWGL